MLIISYAMQIVAEVGALLAWFAIVILGRQPKGLQDMIALGLSYQQRATAYFALLTEDWPPFTDDSASAARVEPAPAFGALASSPPAAGPESPTSVPPGGYASPEREAAFPSAAAPAPEPEPEPPTAIEPPAPEPLAPAPPPPRLRSREPEPPAPPPPPATTARRPARRRAAGARAGARARALRSPGGRAALAGRLARSPAGRAPRRGRRGAAARPVRAELTNP